MSYYTTPYYNLKQPHLGNDWGNWGQHLNENAAAIDLALQRQRTRTTVYCLPALSGSQPVVGFTAPLVTDAVFVTGVPQTINCGTHRLHVAVSSGSGTLTIAGTAIEYHTERPMTNISEAIPVGAGHQYLTDYRYTGNVTLTASAALALTVTAYHGFSFDIPTTLTKITVSGRCRTLTTDLDVFPVVYSRVGSTREVVATDISQRLLDLAVVATTTDRYHVQELLVNQSLTRNVSELVLTVNTDEPNSWDQLQLTLTWSVQ